MAWCPCLTVGMPGHLLLEAGGITMNYGEVKQIFQELKHTSPKDDLTVHIIFTEDSFTKEYPLLSRAYRVSSDNKAFWSHMFSKSIFQWSKVVRCLCRSVAACGE